MSGRGACDTLQSEMENMSGSPIETGRSQLAKVTIAPQVVLQGAAALTIARGSLPSGSLPRVADIGDHAVDTVRAVLEDWWTTMSTGTSDDVAALHQLVTSTATAQLARDHQAAADIEKSSDPFAAFRVG
jgi:hypothetical protein